MCAFMACRGLLKEKEGPNKEYNVPAGVLIGRSNQIKLENSHVSSLPLSIIVRNCVVPIQGHMSEDVLLLVFENDKGMNFK